VARAEPPGEGDDGFDGDAQPAATTPRVLRAELPLLNEAQLAAAVFLARYNGRTLDRRLGLG
jgi:hypothetical protein